MTGLYAANTPQRFWKLLEDAEDSCWEHAVAAAAPVLPDAVRAGLAAREDLLDLVLGEGQFGPERWRLSLAKRAYYQLKPALPRPLTKRLRRLHAHLHDPHRRLGWPVEDRYARFQAEVARQLLAELCVPRLAFIDFWPRRHRFAMVLTHDIETAAGQAFAGTVADVEERLGFRSSFNFVGGLYRLDRGLIADLAGRGFEVGLHGLRHDGRLFSSEAEFRRRTGPLNACLRELGATGFRSPLTHRNPEWMQALEIEYDLSFFDTDPYEPMPGGTMSLWPFQIGSFLELPYTLAQDYTLTVVLGERTTRLWLEKVKFLAACRGMALLNTHPDYLRTPSTLAVYTEFLAEMRVRDDYWQALPKEVARWWRARSAATAPEALPGAVVSWMTAEDPFAADPTRASVPA